jgi:hypothetical protein
MTNEDNNFQITLDYIRVRRDAFTNLDHAFSYAAQRKRRYSSIVTVLVIILGASVSTKAVADQVFGTVNSSDFIIYAILGAFVTILTGLESAFKWSNTSAELRSLATECRKARYAIDTDLRRLLENAPENRQAHLDTAIAVLENANGELYRIENEGAKLGVDLPRDDLITPSRAG